MSVAVGRVLGTQDAHAARVLGGGRARASTSSSTTSWSSTRRCPTARRAPLRRRRPRARPPRGRQFDSDVFLIERGRAAGARCRRPRTSRSRASSPRSSCRRCPGREVRARRTAPTASRRSSSTAWSGALPHRPLARRRARLRATSISSTARAARTSTSPASPASPPRRPTRRSCCTACSRAARSAARPPTRTASSSTSRARTCCSSTSPTRGSRAEARDAVRAGWACPPAPFDSVQLLAPGARELARAPARHGQPAAGRARPSSGRCASSWPSGCCASCSPRPRTPRASSRSSSTGSRRKLAAAAATEGASHDPWIEIEGKRRRDASTNSSRLIDRGATARAVWSSWSRAAPGTAGRVRAAPARGRPRTSGHLIRGRDVGRREDAPCSTGGARQVTRHRHPQPARPGQALRGRRRAQAHVRGEGDAGHGASRWCSSSSTSSTSTRRARATSPIKEVLLDIAERGRSLGIILIGAAADGERGRGPRSSPTPRSAWSAGSTRPRPSGPSTAS